MSPPLLRAVITLMIDCVAIAVIIWNLRAMRRLRLEQQAHLLQLRLQEIYPMNLTPAFLARLERERHLLTTLLPQREIDRLAKYRTCYVSGKEGRLWHFRLQEQTIADDGRGESRYYYHLRTEVYHPREGKVTSMCVNPSFMYRIQSVTGDPLRVMAHYPDAGAPTGPEALLTMLLWVTGDEAHAWKTANKHQGGGTKTFEPYQLALLGEES